MALTKKDLIELFKKVRLWKNKYDPYSPNFNLPAYKLREKVYQKVNDALREESEKLTKKDIEKLEKLGILFPIVPLTGVELNQMFMADKIKNLEGEYSKWLKKLDEVTSD
jgi:hypothetical protein